MNQGMDDANKQGSPGSSEGVSRLAIGSRIMGCLSVLCVLIDFVLVGLMAGTQVLHLVWPIIAYFIFFSLWGICSITGIILGVMALFSIAHSQGKLKNRLTAVYGLFLSTSCLMLFVGWTYLVLKNNAERGH